MQDRSTMISMVSLIALISLLVVATASLLLYRAGVESSRIHLQEMVRTQVSLMEAVARFDAVHTVKSYPQGWEAATLSQIGDAYSLQGKFGKSGEMLIGKQVGDRIEFLVSHKGYGTGLIPSVAWDGPMSEPMRRALRGESGQMVGLDYRNKEVMAAFAPVAALNVGVVAKMDMEEVRAPYLQAGAGVFALALLLVTGGSLLLRRISNPVFEKIKEQNHDLLKVQESLARAQQISHLGNWDWDLVTNELWWSDEIYRIFGLTPQEVVATYDAFLRHIHPDDHAKMDEAMRKALADPANRYEVEHRVVRPDGTERVVIERGEVIRNGLGVPVHVAGTIQDVTERKQAEAQLQLSERVFRDSGEAIMITKANGEIIDVNEAFTRITGYTREEALGKNPNFMKSDRHNREFYAQMWQQISQEGNWKGEVWDRRKDGVVFPKSLTINAVKDGRGEVSHYIGVFSDITQNKLIEQQLQKMAFYDELTDLPNRTLCKERLDHEIKVAHRRDEKLAILFLDLDHFKYVNDTLGHSSGDLLLVEAARRIQGCVRESDTVARLGGDEFMVVLTNISSSKLVERIADCVIRSIDEKFVLHDHEVTIGISIGISLYPDNGTGYDELTKNADAAMYRAKEAGRNTFMFFTNELQVAMVARLTLEKELRQAIERGAFELHYQPRVDLHTGKIVSMEALLRWPRDETIMMPADFIPLAEETGLIIPLGEWVLHQACHQAMVWREAGYTPLRMAVNLSAKQLEQGNIVARIETILRETGLPADALEVEVTESMVMKDADHAVVTLRRLRKLGVTIAVDDFGTGYSSLSYLKRFPIHSLKIDPSFVQELGSNRDDEAIVSAIISMAATLELTVVAEGVESIEQLEFLRRDGCDEVQGALFSRALPATQLVPLLAGNGYTVLRRYAGETHRNGVKLP